MPYRDAEAGKIAARERMRRLRADPKYNRKRLDRGIELRRDSRLGFQPMLRACANPACFEMIPDDAHRLRLYCTDACQRRASTQRAIDRYRAGQQRPRRTKPMTEIERAARRLREHLRQNLGTGAPLQTWSRLSQAERRVWCEALMIAVRDILPDMTARSETED